MSFIEMTMQAMDIGSWSQNVFVKIPVTNTRGDFAAPIIRQLTTAGVQVNVTALLTAGQGERVAECLMLSVGCYGSVFAGDRRLV